MKYLLIVLAIVTCAPLPTWSAEPYPQPGIKWEYRTVSKEQLLELGNKDLAAGLNKLGDEGWELAAVDGAYIFKRTKPGPTQIEDARRRVSQGEADVEGWKERIAWSERMVKKGYLTDRHLQEEKVALQAAESLLDRARKDLKALSPEPKPEK
jgi:hypothetical protein